MSERVQATQSEALRRLRREGRQFAPIRVTVVVIVLVVALTSTPELGLSGRRLGLSICVAVFEIGMLLWPLDRRGSGAARVAELLMMATAAVGIVVLQPNGLAEIPGSATVFLAGVVLSPAAALLVGGGVSVGVVLALGLAGSTGVVNVVASGLLCAVLGITGSLLHRYRISQERTELLLAELEEVRDDQVRAAASEERAVIARELHDVLAHSLSGLSIQLEVARKIAAGRDSPPELRSAIDRAGELAKEGLSEAREAVGALRRADRLGLDQLPALVEQFRRDFDLQISYSVEGASRPVPPEVGLVLYRVVGEALTNVARHAVGAASQVELTFEPGGVRLEVADEGGSSGPLSEMGGGRGLSGLHERVERLQGTLAAGPHGAGWAVTATVPG